MAPRRPIPCRICGDLILQSGIARPKTICSEPCRLEQKRRNDSWRRNAAPPPEKKEHVS